MATTENAAATNDGNIDRVVRPPSLTMIVIDQLRDMIITERFALGEILSENTIAAMLGVSRAPVRDAFVRLQTEGLVVIQPQRGTFVFSYDATELRDICELRQVLETGALRMACARNREDLIAGLRTQVVAADENRAQDPRLYQSFDTAFHDALIAAAGNRELIDAYSRVSGRVRAIRYRLTRLAGQVVESKRVHRAILRALERERDAEAEALLTDHVYASYRRLLETAERTR